MSSYEVYQQDGVPIKAWIKGVSFENGAKQQLINVSKLPFIFKHLVVLPDVHLGKGCCIGSVIPTIGAVIPACTGVDLGCGMISVKTTLTANDLPNNLRSIRSEIEKAIPHGRTDHGGTSDKGSWGWDSPREVGTVWDSLRDDLKVIKQKHPKIDDRNARRQLGTLGSGNHFYEICLDENNNVWLMLHSGSRGIGNQIGSYFIELAKKDMKIHFINLPDKDLAYLSEGTEYFNDYIQGVDWAQNYARQNRELMMKFSLEAFSKALNRQIKVTEEAVNCHHNFLVKEHHYNTNIWITRKGAVRARENDLAIIPGSMGSKSFIVRGKGNPESFQSCSHGAGRAMSRSEAKRKFTIEDHIKATDGVECKKDISVIDETPMAYKNIDAVLNAESDLVEIVHTLKQICCIKG